MRLLSETEATSLNLSISSDWYGWPMERDRFRDLPRLRDWFLNAHGIDIAHLKNPIRPFYELMMLFRNHLLNVETATFVDQSWRNGDQTEFYWVFQDTSRNCEIMLQYRNKGMDVCTTCTGPDLMIGAMDDFFMHIVQEVGARNISEIIQYIS